MELEVKDCFYMLEKRGKQRVVTLYDNLNEAVKKVAAYIKEGVPSDEILLSKIEVREEKLVLEGIPWHQIAEMLIKGT